MDACSALGSFANFFFFLPIDSALFDLMELEGEFVKDMFG